MRSSGVLIVAVFLVIGGIFAIASRDATPPPISEGQAAPGFTLARLGSDAPVRLSDYRGRVVLLNFWATWCKPCKDEMPSMERLHQRLQGQPFELLAVSVDESPVEVEAFVKRLGLTIPILLDPEKTAAGAYQAFRFPETVLIDARGEIAGRFIGPREWDAEVYVERIRRLAAEGSGGAG